MSWDGQNFNAIIDGELADRFYRLLDEMKPLETGNGAYRDLHFDLLKTATMNREPWQVATAIAAGIYGRLRDVAQRYRRTSVHERADYPDLFEVRRKLDEEENEWRASLNLPPVDSEAEE